eukprot:scaffold19965_cov84-Isochrysis_galbana.AAC.1
MVVGLGAHDSGSGGGMSGSGVAHVAPGVPLGHFLDWGESRTWLGRCVDVQLKGSDEGWYHAVVVDVNQIHEQ